MIKIFILQLAFIQIILARTIDYENKELVIMLNEYFKASSHAPELLGYSFYNRENQKIFQIEIKTDPNLVNNVLLFSFKSINELVNISKTEFTHSIIVIHFITNNLPIIAESRLECSKRFFIDEKDNEETWRKSCLIINNY
tara:strand:- start:176 stop:598 length:423 start_codon:yes stop_codon:yes gene_type:complete